MKLPVKEQQEIILGTARERSFSVDSSNSVVFEILRDKMYSNKIGAVAREVASNSRDANREAKNSKNIEIEFTNDNFLSAIGDTSIIFRDFGIGISPDRMENVFLKYAASTKRDSNSQTGGFGLGAKTPFAYTDSFVIKTVCEYDGKRMEFVYNAIIDSTGKGKMIDISEEETDKETGTEIIIPILSNDDRFKFEREVYKSTMYWTGVTYTNFKTSLPIVNYIVDEKDFKIIPFKDANFIGLLDGIPYEVKPENSSAISGYTVMLNLDLEKLTINANRESLQYDEQTIKHINEVYNNYKESLKIIIENYLCTNETFLKAYDKLKKLKNYHNGESLLQSLFRGLKGNSGYNYISYNVKFNDEVVDKINLPNHNILLVKWLGASSKYSNSHLSLDHPIVYLDKGGIRNPKNEKLDKFYLIKPDKSVDKAILAKEKQYLLDLGVELINYSEVKPDRAPVVRVKNDKIKIYLRGYDNPNYDKHEKYFDKTLKSVVGLDSKKVLFVPITDFRSHYNFRGNFSDDKLKVLKYKKDIRSIFYINETAFEKYLKPNGYKKVREVYDTLDLEEFTKYVEFNRIKSMVKEIPPIILENFPEMLPESIIKFMNVTEENVPVPLRNIRWQNLGLKASKFDYDGVIKKYEERLKINYPLLPAYLNHHVKDKEEKIKNIRKYIELTKK